MKHILAKLRNNGLNTRAPRVLGARLYARYLALGLANIPSLLRTGNLREMDHQLGRRAAAFRVHGRPVRFDCGWTDEQVQDGTFAFSAVRELYIRDVYFRHHDPALLPRVRTAVDLGANRGAVSALLAVFADTVLSVEAQASLLPAIRHNVGLNHPRRHLMDCCYIGGAASLDPAGQPLVSMDELLRRHALDHVDFLKVDIEGSEFGLFRDVGWLGRVGALSMELHPAHGDPALLAAVVEGSGMRVITADDDLRLCPPAQAAYLYAARR